MAKRSFTYTVVLYAVLSIAPVNSSMDASMYPTTPANADLQQPIKFECKIPVEVNWRSTTFYDDTVNSGTTSVALFYKGLTGQCNVGASSHGYEVACDYSKGEYNLTILSIEEEYHNKRIRCKAQYGNGTASDVYLSAESSVYVRVPIKNVSLSSDTIVSDIETEVVIDCYVTSRPIASVTWLYTQDHMQDITSSSTYSISGDTINSTLTYKFSEQDNDKELYCFANNSISAMNSSIVRLTILYPPNNNPVIQQTPEGPLIDGSMANLTCSVSGGNPLPILSWNCTGTIVNNTIQNTTVSTLIMEVDRKDNLKTCVCSADHPVVSYKPKVHVTLIVYYPPDTSPTVLQTPSGPIFAGQSVKLKCSVSGGNPLASLSWNCTGIITTTSTKDTVVVSLEFFAQKENHGSVCTCTAVHSVPDYKRTIDHILNVYYAPNIIPEIRQTVPGPIDTGMSVELVCSVTGGNPLTTLSWETCNGTVTDLSTGTTSISGIQFTVDKTNNGMMCTCAAQHPVQSYRPKVNHELVVYYPPTTPTLLPTPSLPWFKGNQTQVNCTSEPGNPASVFEWRRNGVVMNNEDNFLSLGPLSSDDNGVGIRCVVKNEYTIRHDIQVESDILTLNVEYIPSVNVDKYVLLSNEGENVNMTCFATGNPSPLVQWMAKDHNLSKPEVGKSIIEINNINRGLNGEFYICKAVSQSVVYGLLAADKRVNITVFYKPRIIKLESSNGGNPIPEKSNTSLRCHVDSNPLSNITWTFQEDVTPLKMDNGMEQSEYSISKATCYNTGVIRCQASNVLKGKTETDVRSFHLDVTCKPRINSRLPPVTEFVAVDDNGPLNITLNLVANPEPDVTWMSPRSVVNSTLISNGILHSSNLFIPKLSKEDIGEYNIITANIYGISIIRMKVVTRGKPYPPVNVVVFCKSTSISVRWRPGFDGGDEQQFRVYCYQQNQIVSSSVIKPDQSEDLYYSMDGLLSETKYSCNVASSNLFGQTFSTNSSCVTDKEISQVSEVNSANNGGTAMLVIGITLTVLVVPVTGVFIFIYCKRKGDKSLSSDSYNSPCIRSEGVPYDSISSDDSSYVRKKSFTKQATTAYDSIVLQEASPSKADQLDSTKTRVMKSDTKVEYTGTENLNKTTEYHNASPSLEMYSNFGEDNKGGDYITCTSIEEAKQAEYINNPHGRNKSVKDTAHSGGTVNPKQEATSFIKENMSKTTQQTYEIMKPPT